MIRRKPREPHHDEVFGKHRAMLMGPCQEFERGEIRAEENL